MPRNVRISLIQMDVGPDRKTNLALAARLVARVARVRPDIVCLPELFSYMGHFHPAVAPVETEDGPSLSLVRELARRHRIMIVAGSILIRARRGLPTNTSFIVDARGEVLARYSKLHLFDIHIPEKIHYSESDVTQPGREVVVADTAVGRVGVAICNDLRYPEVFRAMALSGARIVFVPSAFTRFTGREHWFALNRVRAVENQMVVCAVNQSGQNVHGVHFFGTSLLVDPWGKVVVQGPARGNAVRVAEIDLAAVDTIRRQLPALKKIRAKYPVKVG